jgi:hypothetical protein
VVQTIAIDEFADDFGQWMNRLEKYVCFSNNKSEKYTKIIEFLKRLIIKLFHPVHLILINSRNCSFTRKMQIYIYARLRGAVFV